MTFEKYLFPQEHCAVPNFSDLNPSTFLKAAFINYLVLMKSEKWNYETQQSTSLRVTTGDKLADMNDPMQQLLVSDHSFWVFWKFKEETP